MASPSADAPARMPVLFVGHGSPMNAVQDNATTRGFTALGQALPRPRAILSISAHWYIDGTRVTAASEPETIHDFGGFPSELYAIHYPAPGDPGLAARVGGLLGEGATPSADRGLDHGTWTVLKWIYPEADVPVVQLSLDRRLAPAEHFALARGLSPLRDEGVLVFASGNVTHNLPDAFRQMRASSHETPDWARRFDGAVAQAARTHDTEALVALWPTHPDARQAHPTPDHWLPLLYALGAREDGDAVSFPVEGFELGSLSMRSILWR